MSAEVKPTSAPELRARPSLGAESISLAALVGRWSLVGMVVAFGLGYLERRQHRAQRAAGAEVLRARMRLADLHDAAEGSGPCIRDPGGTCRNELHYPSVHGDNLYPGCARAHAGTECNKREHRWPMSDENEDLEAMAGRLPPEGVGLVLPPADDNKYHPGDMGLAVDELTRIAHAPGAEASPDPAQPGGTAAPGGESEPGPES